MSTRKRWLRAAAINTSWTACWRELPKGARVGVELGAIPMGMALYIQNQGFTLCDIGAFIQHERYIKSAEEIAMMEKAGDLVSKAMAASLEQVRPGVTEMDMDQFGNA